MSDWIDIRDKLPELGQHVFICVEILNNGGIPGANAIHEKYVTTALFTKLYANPFFRLTEGGAIYLSDGGVQYWKPNDIPAPPKDWVCCNEKLECAKARDIYDEMKAKYSINPNKFYNNSKR